VSVKNPTTKKRQTYNVILSALFIGIGETFVLPAKIANNLEMRTFAPKITERIASNDYNKARGNIRTNAREPPRSVSGSLARFEPELSVGFFYDLG